ncbi:hypothetical protein BDFB_008069 [Asbolus verrucosus]|uniref:Uncharacterized protein n=1 Tax=Asbolus verrucosus TaxID=1661398 RepID=A0A482V1T9_ASBVE|nr:hypothetical protein BDFB_008069 [Asbolus verrucosus]
MAGRLPGACRLVVPVASDSRHRLGRTLVLQARDCARTRSPRADWHHQVSVADIIPAGPLTTAPLVASRMPFVMVKPLVGASFGTAIHHGLRALLTHSVSIQGTGSDRFFTDRAP